MTGIYMLKNKLNDNCYVGQSVNIHKRWIDHKTPSKRSHGTVLARALSKYGCENFELIVLEYCSDDKLNEREIYYIDSLKPIYNMNEGGLGNRGHRLSVEVKNRLSASGKKQWEAKTDDERKAVIVKQLFGPRKGHEVKPETREKLRQSALKQFADGMPEAQRNKIGQAHKGRKKNYIAKKAPVEQISIDTGKVIMIYETTKEAAFTVGVTSSNITSVCRGRQNTAAGFIWKYHLRSVETIPKGSRVENELPLEARGNSKRVEEIVQALMMEKSGELDKGYLQLCMRTGAYRYINADAVYEGELISADKLTGEIVIDSSKRASDKKVGYFAFIETLNGFRKTFYMTTEEVDAHARKYSKNYNSKFSTWATDFDAMALKTCLRLLLSKYGVMSIEMQSAYIADNSDVVALADEATGDAVTIDVTPAEPMSEEEYNALLQAEQTPEGAL
jgi:group I intron endonuclease